MSQQKFFSGLTQGMMNRSAGIDRQKSNLFWPTEEDNDDESNKSETYGQRNRKSVVQNENGEHNNNNSHRHSNNHNQNNHNNHNDDVEMEKMIKSRHVKQLNSNIEFNDDVVDNSCFDATSTNNIKHNMKHRNSTRNEDFRIYSRQTSGESEELSPRKQNVSSIKFYDFDESANNRNDYNARVPRNGDYHTTSSRYTGSYVYDEELPSRRNRANSTPEVVHQEQPRSPPNPHRHLKSSINFSDGYGIAEQEDDYKKPVSVRDSAVKRVGVGLPNM